MNILKVIVYSAIWMLVEKMLPGCFRIMKWHFSISGDRRREKEPSCRSKLANARLWRPTDAKYQFASAACSFEMHEPEPKVSCRVAARRPSASGRVSGKCARARAIHTTHAITLRGWHQVDAKINQTPDQIFIFTAHRSRVKLFFCFLCTFFPPYSHIS